MRLAVAVVAVSVGSPSSTYPSGIVDEGAIIRQLGLHVVREFKVVVVVASHLDRCFWLLGMSLYHYFPSDVWSNRLVLLR